MFSIQIRSIELEELDRVYEIDRSESVERMYRQHDGVLESYEDKLIMDSDKAFWDQRLPDWKEAVSSGANAFGAYDNDRMIGFAIVDHEVRESMDQILALYVSAEYRLSGIAKSLYLEMLLASKKTGAENLYVSATPTGSAVGFYLSQGFKPSEHPLESAVAAAPDEIQMEKNL